MGHLLLCFGERLNKLPPHLVRCGHTGTVHTVHMLSVQHGQHLSSIFILANQTRQGRPSDISISPTGQQQIFDRVPDLIPAFWLGTSLQFFRNGPEGSIRLDDTVEIQKQHVLCEDVSAIW